MKAGATRSSEAALRTLLQASLNANRGLLDGAQILDAVRGVAAAAPETDAYWQRAMLVALAGLLDAVLSNPRLAAGERIAVFRLAAPVLLNPRAGATGRTILRLAIGRILEREPSPSLPPLAATYSRSLLRTPVRTESGASEALIYL